MWAPELCNHRASEAAVLGTLCTVSVSVPVTQLCWERGGSGSRGAAKARLFLALGSCRPQGDAPRSPSLGRDPWPGRSAQVGFPAGLGPRAPLFPRRARDPAQATAHPSEETWSRSPATPGPELAPASAPWPFVTDPFPSLRCPSRADPSGPL